jgi:DNA invertase Pin-like site-specific DNA recombinase
MMTMEKFAAIYARVSTIDQTAASQMPDLEAWAKAQSGPVKVYEPDHFTGRSMRRPRFNAVMADVRAGLVHTLVVWRLDRLGRSCAGVSSLIDELRGLGVSLVSIREGFDLSTPTGRAMFQVIATFAELETEIRAERVRAGVQSARLELAQIQEGLREGLTDEEILVQKRIADGRKVSAIEKIRRIRAGGGERLYWGGAKKGHLFKQSAPHERVKELFAKGLTPEEIGRALGVGRSAVYRRINDLGGIDALRGQTQEVATVQELPADPAPG